MANQLMRCQGRARRGKVHRVPRGTAKVAVERRASVTNRLARAEFGQVEGLLQDCIIVERHCSIHPQMGSPVRSRSQKRGRRRQWMCAHCSSVIGVVTRA